MTSAYRCALTLTLSLCIFAPQQSEARPYEDEVNAAATRWDVNANELRALINTISGFKPGNSRSLVGIGRFSGVAAKEVARIAKFSHNSKKLDSDPSLKAVLQNFNLTHAKVARSAIEATAIYYRHLHKTYGGPNAALTHYRDGRLKALAVKRHGLAEARHRDLISSGTKDFIDKVLAKAREEAEARPIGSPPSPANPRGSGNGSTGNSTPTPTIPPTRSAPSSSTAPSAPANITLPPATAELKKHWTTSAPRRTGRVRSVQQDPRKYDALIQKAAKRWGIDANLLRGLIQAESMFDPRARSPTGAAGLGQFTGVAIAEIKRLAGQQKYSSGFDDDPALKTALLNFNKTKAHTPVYAVEASALYLKYVLDRYKSEEAALTAYNAGHKMARHVQRYGSHAAARRAGVLTFSQSNSYAPKVLKYKSQFKSGNWPGVTTSGMTGSLGGR